MCFACMYVSVHHSCAWGWMGPEEGIISSRTGVTDIDELYVGAGNRIQVFWRSSQCSQVLSHLSSYTLKTVLEREPFGRQWDDSVSQGHWQPSNMNSSPGSLCRRRELTPERCPLVSAPIPWHMCTCTRARVHTHNKRKHQKNTRTCTSGSA